MLGSSGEETRAHGNVPGVQRARNRVGRNRVGRFMPIYTIYYILYTIYYILYIYNTIYRD